MRAAATPAAAGAPEASSRTRFVPVAAVTANPTVHVEQVDFLTIPTRDVERSVAFYRDVFGLEPGVEGEVETPNVTLSFWNPERDGEAFVANRAGFALRVGDVAAARAELEAKGVEFYGETYDSGVCHMAFAFDPDGNTVILHRRYAPRG
jgi:catechol 2,3-dioxygenase-like lactoylglutathione lyase family enzyme